MERSADWLKQAKRDLEKAELDCKTNIMNGAALPPSNQQKRQ